MIYTRFIACGDSFTEGMTDDFVEGQYRGWADRVADILASGSPDFTYANLAIRGKLVRQVVSDQVPVAMTFVTGKETVVSFHAGANDVLRPNYKQEIVLPLYAQAVSDLAASGATVLLFTVLERTGNTGKTADIWAARFSEFNKNVRAIAQEVGAVVADANEDSFMSDLRFLAKDRLHLNPMGHDRVAQGVLEVLGLPFAPQWRTPLPPAPAIPFLRRSLNYAQWFTSFLIPWMWRRVRGKSSGDGRSAKYPTPISWSISRPPDMSRSSLS